MSATDDAPRRRSGRVAPKRKHTDYADLGSSSQDDSSSGEPDEQEVREKRRKTAKKPKVNGASQTNLAHRPAPSKAKKTQKPRKAPIRKSALIDEDVSGLYAEVFAHGNNLEDVAAQWVSAFMEHEARAVADVVNFVLRAAGCTIKITEDDIGDPDNCPNRLAEIQDEYQGTEITDYPLLSKTRGGTAFKNALHGFFVALIRTIAEKGLLYENTELIENIEVWISTMSSAGNRPFRHTSTVASLAIMSALARIGGEIVENTAKKIRQSEGESKKARVNKGRVSAVNKEVQELTQRGKLVDETLTDWFNTVYMHRYRDVDPHIRVECVEAMADWIMSHPDKFFDGTHLRYLGWVLSDPHAPTRLEVLRQLQKLFKDSNKLAGLKTFTERFRPRIVEMATQDAETNVRTAAIQLLDVLRDAGFLEPDDIDSVGRLVFDAEPRVRKAVVGFFAETINSAYEMQIDDMGGQEALDEALAPPEGEEGYENPRLEWLKLKCLVEQLQAYDSEDANTPTQIERIAPAGSELGLAASGIESRFFLATQAIYDAVPEIRSWEVIAGYLLYDHSRTAQDGAGEDIELMLRQNCKLEEDQETTLLDILNASVKIGLQHLVDAQKDRKKSKTQREADEEEHAETVRKLSALIPQLLKKFGAVPEAASLCLRLERELDLDVFIELRQTTALTELLDDVIRQFLTHHNERVLDEAIQSMRHHLTHEESQEITESRISKLWDELVETFNVLRANQDIAARGDLPPNILTGLSNTILKISKLAQISDPSCLDRVPHAPTHARSKRKDTTSTTPPISTLLRILERGVPVSDVDGELDIAEDALVSHTMKAFLLYFVWKYRFCVTHLSSSTPIPDDDLTLIATTRDSCLTALMRIMQSRKGADDLRLQAANLLLDTYNIFYTLKTSFAPSTSSTRTPRKPQSRGKDSTDETNEDFLVLAQKIDAPTTRTLLSILSAAESALAKRNHRPLEEPVGIDDDPVDPDDEDPASSSDEAEDAAEGDARVMEERRVKALLAEGRLCFLGSRLVNAIQVGTLGEDVRKRLLLNTKLSHDWKEVVAHLDAKKMAAAAAKGKKTVQVKEPAEKPAAKSKEIVVESDSEEEEEEERGDEIEDEEMRDQGEGEEVEVNGNGNGNGNGDGGSEAEVEEEVESVIGD